MQLHRTSVAYSHINEKNGKKTRYSYDMDCKINDPDFSSKNIDLITFSRFLSRLYNYMRLKYDVIA